MLKYYHKLCECLHALLDEHKAKPSSKLSLLGGPSQEAVEQEEEEDSDGGLAEGSLCERRSRRSISYEVLERGSKGNAKPKGEESSCSDDDDGDLAEGSLTQRSQVDYTAIEVKAKADPKQAIPAATHTFHMVSHTSVGTATVPNVAKRWLLRVQVKPKARAKAAVNYEYTRPSDDEDSSTRRLNS